MLTSKTSNTISSSLNTHFNYDIEKVMTFLRKLQDGSYLFYVLKFMMMMMTTRMGLFETRNDLICFQSDLLIKCSKPRWSGKQESSTHKKRKAKIENNQQAHIEFFLRTFKLVNNSVTNCTRVYYFPPVNKFWLYQWI